MTQWVKGFGTKSNDPNSIPVTIWSKARADSCKLSSDLCTCMYVCTHTHLYIHIQIINVIKLLKHY